MARKTTRLRFGLIDGQLSPRATRVAKNAGWYDARGRKIGDGDLSAEQLRRIAAGLRRGECFIVLPETYAKHAFAFPKQFRGAGTHGPERRPGRLYVLRHALYAVLPRRVCTVDRYGDLAPEGYERHGVRFARITPEELARRIGAKTK